jgi:hypothetical protein
MCKITIVIIIIILKKAGAPGRAPEKTEIPKLGFPVLGILPPSGFLVSRAPRVSYDATFLATPRGCCPFVLKEQIDENEFKGLTLFPPLLFLRLLYPGTNLICFQIRSVSSFPVFSSIFQSSKGERKVVNIWIKLLFLKPESLRCSQPFA